MAALIIAFWVFFFSFLGVCDRTPMTKDFPGSYPLDEEWNGYINDNDRVLLKVVVFFVHT